LQPWLPNGFHDPEVHSVSIEFDAQVATLILDVWMGTIRRVADAPRSLRSLGCSPLNAKIVSQTFAVVASTEARKIGLI
jgi:hypothetical protein